MSVEIEIIEENGISFIRPKTDLHNITSINEFGEILNNLTKNKDFKLVLDMTDVMQIDSIGLGHIVKMCVNSAAKNSKFSLCGINNDVRNVLDLAIIPEMIKIFATREECVTYSLS